MKGTRPRGSDPAADAALAARARGSRQGPRREPDDRRSDSATTSSRVAVPGSVRVEAPFAVESYPTVHQMVSTVRARLRDGLGAVDVLARAVPCGSITGAPKIRAMELIDAAERDARGAYCGAIGRIDPPGALPAGNEQGAGDAAFNVAIRTLRLAPGENGAGRAVLGVGSAIVADSEWLPEWRECLVKGSFVRTSTATAQSCRLRPDRDDGLRAGRRHRTARAPSRPASRRAPHELGFACDRAELQHAVEALVAGAAEPQRVRLVLARSGAFALEAGTMPDTAARSGAVRGAAAAGRQRRLAAAPQDQRPRLLRSRRWRRRAPPEHARRSCCATTGWSPRAASPTCSSSATACC